jgi:hypothetical protein
MADKLVENLIGDLSTLRRYLLRNPRVDAATSQKVAVQYLLENEALILAGVEAWRSLGEEKRKTMGAQYTELHYSAIGNGFYGIATGALNSARSWPGLLNDDELHMLQRVLEYAKYSVDSSGFQLKMHPIIKYLPRFLVKEATVRRRSSDYYEVLIEVRGGLTEENEAAFLNIRFDSVPSEGPIERMVSEAVPMYENEHDPCRPFHTVLRVPALSLNYIVSVLRNGDFKIHDV